MDLTPDHAKYFAYELTRRGPPDSVEKLAGALADAQVDLNPHQIDAALFAFRSPLSKGAILADEVGLGKDHRGRPGALAKMGRAQETNPGDHAGEPAQTVVPRADGKVLSPVPHSGIKVVHEAAGRFDPLKSTMPSANGPRWTSSTRGPMI